MMRARISLADVLAIHRASIERFGGGDVVRDQGLLESAISLPHQTFGGTELYPTPALKAARLAYGICCNHPFEDGNKRTAAACLGTSLIIGGIRFAPNHKEFLEVMYGVADGTVGYEPFAQWVDGEVSR